MKATVYKSTGSWYTLKDADGNWWNARMKGVIKLDEITSTNPVAVGDIVLMEPEDKIQHSSTITEILDRRNYINRQSPRAKYQHHIIAANIDQSFLIATLKEPRTSQGFIDRFLVASEMYHVPAVIIFNKADLHKKKEQEKYEEWKAIYENAGYKVLQMSIKEKTGLNEVIQMLKQKTTLISGHSGVGKTAFINEILPELGLKTQDVSGWSGKGLHTTTFAEMYDLPSDPDSPDSYRDRDFRDGGKIIDTPGMREFGLVDLPRQELSHYFPEMRELLVNCQFNNCLHINEPGCVVKDAVINGGIPEDRYISYVKILDSIENRSF